jgi:hypothetical protein
MADNTIRSATDLDEQAWSTLDRVVRRFEAAWKAAEFPQLAPFLPDDDAALRELVLVELVKIDQEYRWNSAIRKRLEDYLDEWPQLGESEETVKELLESECLTRIVLGESPTLEELRSRFPRICQSIDLPGIGARAEREKGTSQGLHLDDTATGTFAHTPSGGPSEQRLVVGQTFGRYKILGRLGQGGMGAVYRAYDTKLEREVALKVPRLGPRQDHSLVKRLVQEAKAAAKINHPNICPVFDADQIDDIAYITMRLVAGESLAQRLKAGPMETGEAVRLACKIAHALAAVHAGGIVHRDIKPSNVILDASGEPLLTDFGLARPALEGIAPGSDSSRVGGATGQSRFPDGILTNLGHGRARDRLTRTGDLPGTLPYMSPEQIGGEEADAQTDIYSLGVLLYQTLTGALPFSGGPVEIVRSIRESNPPSPRSIRPDLAPELEAICLKAMAKRRSDRYTSASDLAAALGQYLEKSSAATTARRRRNAGIAAAVIGLLLGLTIYFKTGEGTLTIEVAEPNATVTVDGRDSANHTVALSVGEHVLEVGKEGFKTHKESLVIRWRGQGLEPGLFRWTIVRC